MNKKLRLIFTLILSFPLLLMSQVPQGINYQAVARDGSGNLLANTNLTVRLGVYSGPGAAVKVYEETHATSTNTYGLFTVVIGDGTATSGTFPAINWKGDIHSLKVEVDAGSGYVNLGTNRLQSVPYALSSGDGLWSRTATDIYYTAGDVGIGTATPTDKFEVVESGIVAGRMTNLEVTGTLASANDILQLKAPNGAPDDFQFIEAERGGIIEFRVHGNGDMETNGDIEVQGDGYVMGDFGIGTAAPSEKLVVAGGNLKLDGSNNFVSIDNSSATMVSGYRFYSSGSFKGAMFYHPSGDYLNISRSAISDMLTIASSGNIGIGTSNPQDGLHIDGSLKLRVGSAETIEDGGGNLLKFLATLAPNSDNTSYLDIGSSSLRWDDVYATNGTIQTSDRRDKTAISNTSYGLAEVMKLNPVTFKWKNRENEPFKIGLIAQDVYEVIPEVVKTHDYRVIDDMTGETELVENERLGIYYSDLIPVLINAIKEQQSTIKSLEERINFLESK